MRSSFWHEFRPKKLLASIVSLLDRSALFDLFCRLQKRRGDVSRKNQSGIKELPREHLTSAFQRIQLPCHRAWLMLANGRVQKIQQNGTPKVPKELQRIFSTAQGE
jgi:hypothetical protein